MGAGSGVLQAIAIISAFATVTAFFAPSSTAATPAAVSQLPHRAARSELRMAKHAPRAPLPPIILSNVPGTWAYDTMSRRVRENILMRIYDENDMDSPELAHAKTALDALVQELATPQTSLLTPIPDDGGPDVREWNESIMAPYLGAANWLDAPWLYTEFYVYRRVAAAFAFFTTAYDPFDAQKRLGVTSALASMDALAARLLQSDAVDVAEGLLLYVTTALWGNRMDLSLWPVGEGAASGSSS
eukprot:TRINITY_DN7622_c0_g1_i1.p1 TRINITY_DN7622_c0_g1~~TRINITY_DN7622_c0_g1_i1.p1  ORF type:complete len:254 (-),score=83.00 TRINITY_DN7622_c0_g1_i1:548-1279(-)